MVAVSQGKTSSAGGRFWSRLTEEGLAIRGTQKEMKKTLEDALKASLAAEQGG